MLNVDFILYIVQQCLDQLQYGIVKVNLVSHTMALAVSC
jgi:hypothetical protein